MEMAGIARALHVLAVVVCICNAMGIEYR